jgi:NADH:ubiquinone oxidoreductase subunit E
MAGACYVKAVKAILSRLGSGLNLEDGNTTEDRRFCLKVVCCLDACGLAPAMVVDQDPHRGMAPDNVIGVLDHYNEAGRDTL